MRDKSAENEDKIDVKVRRRFGIDLRVETMVWDIFCVAAAIWVWYLYSAMVPGLLFCFLFLCASPVMCSLDCVLSFALVFAFALLWLVCCSHYICGFPVSCC